MNNKQYKHDRGGSDPQHKADQALFSELLKNHSELKRKTVQIENGIIATTTSSNPKLVKVLQDHVAGMEKRFSMGRAIRSWDPLFAALFEYRNEINMQYEAVENGIKATLTTDSPKLVDLIQSHDTTLHGFVKEGSNASRLESPKPNWLD